MQAGNARFEVLTPSLIRLEYAADGAFEDRPTLTAIDRSEPAPAFTASDSLGVLTIATSAMTVRYVEGTGPFTPANTTVQLHVGGVDRLIAPTFSACGQAAAACGATGVPGTVVDGTATLNAALGNAPATVPAPSGLTFSGRAIGGWTREVADAKDVRAPLHPGLLRTSGWYLLDDTATAVLTSPTTSVPRPSHTGPYEDGYLFGYGHDYPLALRDLASLTGPPTLLPEWTFGPWFSRYYAYSASDYEHSLLPAFRAHGTPVDGLSIDTNAKGPDSWNGWEWNPSLIPDPRGFLSWAAAQGLHVALNIHPSIDGTDPRFAQAQQIAGGGLTAPSGGCEFYRQSPTCYVFDWGQAKQAAAYDWLGAPFLADGVSAFWLDWCCDASTVSTPGATPDSWINQLYGQQMLALGRRPFVLTRIGSGIFDENGYTGDVNVPATGPWADHREAIAFTGDADSDWATLAFEAKLTAGEGSAIGEPYLSNDIGGYAGNHLADDLYVRWLQLGAFSPIMRLHSNHGERLPWEYDAAAEVPAERLMRLREALVPYLYSVAAEGRSDGLPMARALALDWPDQPAALKATDEWMLGDSLLVAPIVSAGTTASRSVWLPPGQWTDFFTGVGYEGGRSVTVSDGLGSAPVFVRAAGVVVLAPPMSHVAARSVDPLTVRVGAGGGSSSFPLYEDAGDGLGFLRGDRAVTTIRSRSTGGARSVHIGPVHGAFPGIESARAYAVQFLGVGAAPASVTVDGHAVPAADPGAVASVPDDPTATVGVVPAADGWTWSATTHVLTVLLSERSVAHSTTVEVQDA